MCLLDFNFFLALHNTATPSPSSTIRLGLQHFFFFFGHCLTITKSLIFGAELCGGMLWAPPLGSRLAAVTKPKLFEQPVHIKAILHYYWLFLSLHCGFACELTQHYFRCSYLYFYWLLLFFFSWIWMHETCNPKISIQTSF